MFGKLGRVVPLALALSGSALHSRPEALPASSRDFGFRFEEVAVASGVAFRYTFGDFAYDNILESSGSGVTWLDYDLDGDIDLYLLNGVYLEGVSDPKGRRPFAGATNRFYENQGNGLFADRTARTGLGDSTWSMAAAAADYDDDGYPDIFIANYGPNRLFHNEGDGTFTEVAEELGVAGAATLNDFVKWSAGASWFDANRDGLLDLAVCNFLAFDPLYLHPGKEWEMPEPVEYEGQPSQLYLQRTDGGFVDVTGRAGIHYPQSKCMGITVMDFDRDGFLDIFQGNDHQANFLFRARGDGTYEELAAEAGVALNDQAIGTGSMHGSPGDVDGDGLLDLLVVDLRHGSLYRQIGPMLFEDVTWKSGVGRLLDGLGQWGAGLADLDLDGDLDLFSTNGVAHILVEQPPALAANDGSGNFVDARRGAGPYFAGLRSGRGASFGDYDNDGDTDIVISHVDHQAEAALLRNQSQRQGHWIGVSLNGRRPLTAHGARLRLDAGERRLLRVHQPAASYLSGNDPRVHFGLGPVTRGARLTVTWPSGLTQVWEDLEADRYLTLDETLGFIE